MGDLTENFSKREFACKCGCGLDSVQPTFVNRLQTAKDYLKTKGQDYPLVIKSGLRCEAHNKAVGGEANSSHMTGWAADIACAGNVDRYFLHLALMMGGFTRIGVDKQYLHVDCDPAKPPYREWVYPL